MRADDLYACPSSTCRQRGLLVVTWWRRKTLTEIISRKQPTCSCCYGPLIPIELSEHISSDPE